MRSTHHRISQKREIQIGAGQVELIDAKRLAGKSKAQRPVILNFYVLDIRGKLLDIAVDRKVVGVLQGAVYIDMSSYRDMLFQVVLIIRMDKRIEIQMLEAERESCRKAFPQM